MVHFSSLRFTGAKRETCVLFALAGGIGKVYLGRESISGDAYTYVLQVLRQNYRIKEPRGVRLALLVYDFDSGSEHSAIG